MKSCSEYRAQARETLSGRWNAAIPAMLIYLLACVLYVAPSTLAAVRAEWLDVTGTSLQDGLGFIIYVLVLIPLGYALHNMFLCMARRSESAPHADMFRLFRTDYSRSLPAMLMMILVVGIAAVFTFGILGIVLAYAYRMMPYLLADYPELSPREALRMSREMMRGRKWDLFVLDFSFIGWVVLAILTCCIGMLWVTPYMEVASAHFYQDLKDETIVEE